MRFPSFLNPPPHPKGRNKVNFLQIFLRQKLQGLSLPPAEEGLCHTCSQSRQSRPQGHNNPAQAPSLHWPISPVPTCPQRMETCGIWQISQKMTQICSMLIVYLDMRTAAWTDLRVPWHTRVMSVPVPSLYSLCIAIMKSSAAPILSSEKVLFILWIYAVQIQGVPKKMVHSDF